MRNQSTVNESTLVPVNSGNGLLSRLARRAKDSLANSRRPFIIWLSHKLKLTVNPRPVRRLSRLTVMLLLPFVPSLVQALPQGGQVSAGQAAIAQPAANKLTVQQSSQKAVIDWRNFSIAKGESVVFNQPNAAAVTLNRVLSGNPSEIFGSLRANGSVFLTNSAGVFFAPGAAVNVGSFVGSTLSMSNQDFMAGNYRFTQGANAAAVRNDGRISVQPGGYLALIGPQVINNGSLIAPGGNVALAAGERVTLAVGGSGLLNVSVDASVLKAKVSNTGDIQADGGQVLITAKSADALLDTVINTSGTIRATSLQQRDGKIILDGGTRGVVQVTGKLDASSATDKGGSIKVLGDKVSVKEAAKVDASGQTGGGEILIGGNYQGKGPEQNASMTFIGNTAEIKADAGKQGDGGKVIVWADGHTSFQGKISARGGNIAGNGGLVETSGKAVLEADGVVDAGAPNGKGGLWLLDPYSISITTGSTSNMSQAGSEFTSTGSSAVLKNTSISAALAANTNVKVQTGGSAGDGKGNGNISVEAPINASGDNATLTLEAFKSITFTGTGSISNNTHDNLNVFLHAGVASGVPGVNTGDIDMQSGSSIVTNGGNVTMVAKDNVTLRTVNTGTGNLSVTSSYLTLTNATLTGVSGVITLQAASTSAGMELAQNSSSNWYLNSTEIGKLKSSNASSIVFGRSDSTATVSIHDTLDLAGRNVTLLGGQGTVDLNSETLSAAGLTITTDTYNTGETGTLNLTGGFTLQPGTANRAIGLNNSGGLNFTNADIAKVNSSGATSFTLGGASSTGALTISSSTTPTTFTPTTVNLQAGSLVGGKTVTATTLNLTANSGDIASSGTPFALSATTVSATANTANADAYLSSSGAMKLGATSVNDLLSVSAGGALTQSGVITAGKLAVSNAGHNITLGENNQIAKLSTINAGSGSVALTNTQALSQNDGVITADSFAITNSGGDVTLSEANAITKLGAVNISGGNFKLNNSASNLTLEQNLNLGTNALELDIGNKTLDFNGKSVTAGDLTLTSDAVNLSGVSLQNVTGALTVQPSTVGANISLLGSETYNLSAADITALSESSATKLVVGRNDGTGTLSINGNAKFYDSVNTVARDITLRAGTISNSDPSAALLGKNIVLQANTGDVGSIASPILHDSTSVAANVSAGSAYLTSNFGHQVGGSNVSGTLNITAAGNLTQSGVIKAGSLVVSNPNKSINFSTQNNEIASLGAINAGTSSVLLKNTVALNQTGVMTANTLSLTNSGGDVKLNQANALTNLGAVTVTGGSFALTNANSLTVAATLNTGSGAATLDVGTNTLTLGSNSFTSGDLTLTGDNLSFSSATLTDVTGALTLQPSTQSQKISLRGTEAFDISASEISALSKAGASSIVIGRADGSGALTIDGNATFVDGSSYKNVSLRAGTISKTNSSVLTGGNILLQANNGDIGSSSANISHDSSSIGVQATGNAFLTSSYAQKLAASDVTGSLQVTSAGKNLTQSGVVKAGTLVISNPNGVNKLDDFTNQIATLGEIDAGASGSFALKNTGALVQGSGTIIQADSLSVENTGAVTLDKANKINNLGAVSVTGGDFLLNNTDGGGVALTLGGMVNAASNAVSINTGTANLSLGSNTLTAGTLTLTADSMALGTATLANTGVLTLQPSTATQAMSVGGSAGFDLSGSELTALKNSTASSVVLGSSGHTGSLTLGSDLQATALTLNAGSIVNSASHKITTGTLALNAATGDVGSANNPLVHSATNVALNAPGGSAYLSSAAGYNLDTATIKSDATLGLVAGGALTQSAAITGATLLVENTGGATTLTNVGNTFATLGSFNAAGQDVSLVTTKALSQTGVMTANKLTLTNTGGATTLNQANAVAGLGIIKSQSGDFLLKNTANGGTALHTQGYFDMAGHDLTLNVGTAQLNVGGQKFTARNVVLTTDDFKSDSLGSSTTLSGSFTLTPATDATNITLGAGSGSFNLAPQDILDLKNSGATSIVLGSYTGTGSISVKGDANFGSANLALRAGSIVHTSGKSLTAGNLELLANKSDIGSSAIPVVFTASNGVTANAVAGSAYLSSTSGYVIGASEVKNTLSLSAGAALSQSAALKAGSLVLTNTAADTTFNTFDNEIAALGAISASGQDFALKNNKALTQSDTLTAASLALENTGNVTLNKSNNITSLAAIKVTGDLSLTTANAMTQSAAMSVTGNATFDSGTAAITLNHASNSFGGTVAASNKGNANISLTDTTPLVLGSVNAGSGSVSLISGGSVSQNEGLTAGTTSVTLKDVNGDVVLDNVQNDISGTVTYAVNNATLGTATLVNANVSGSVASVVMPTNLTNLNLTYSAQPLSLPATTLSGNLSVTAGAAVTQAGKLVVDGTTSLNLTGSGSHGMTLDNVANEFKDSVAVNVVGSGTVALSAAGGVKLAESALATGGLSVSAGDAIVQDGKLTQDSGAAKLSFTTSKGAVSLNHADNAFTGPVALNSYGATVNNKGAVVLDEITVQGANALSVTGVGISQSGSTVISTAGTSSFQANSGPITLNNANSFSGSVALNNQDAHDVALKTSGALDLATSSVGTGKFTVQAGAAISQSGALTQTAGAGAASFTTTTAAITLDKNNLFTGAVSLNNQGAHDVLVYNTGALVMGASDLGSGKLDVTAAGSISQNGAIEQDSSAGNASFTVAAAGSNILLASAENKFTGSVVMDKSGAGTLLTAALRNVNADAVAPTLNTIPVDLTLQFDNAAIDLKATTLTGNLSVTAGGAITQSGILDIGGTSSFNANKNPITLTANNKFGNSVSVKNQDKNDVKLNSVGALDLAESNVGGNLTVTAGGKLTQVGTVTQVATDAASSFKANGSITLNLNNDFGGKVGLQNSGANAVELKDVNALVLAASTVGSASLSITADGNISQLGAISQEGAGAVSIKTGAGSITLDDEDNQFKGSVSLENTGTNNVTLVNSGDLDLGKLNLGNGSLSVTAKGALTQSDTIQQAADTGSSSASFKADTSITLTKANQFTGAVKLENSGANPVQLTAAGALTLGQSAVGSGAVSITAGGKLAQSGAFTQSGAGAVTIHADGYQIDLNNAGNDFLGTLSLSNASGNVSLVDVNSLNLGELVLGSGSLSVTAGSGISQGTGNKITQSGSAGVSFDAGSGALNLGNDGNALKGAIALKNQGAFDINLKNDTATILGASSIADGKLTVVAAGDISQQGALTQSGTGVVAVTAGNNKLELNHADNDFNGSLRLSNSGDKAVSVVDKNSLQLGVSQIGKGNLSVSTGGALTQDGAIVQEAGASGASFNANSNAITLSNDGNILTGPVTLSNQGNFDVSLRNATALDLAASNVGSGTLTLQSAGALTQSGALKQAGAGQVIVKTGEAALSLNHADNEILGALGLFNSKAHAVTVNNNLGLSLGNSEVGSSTLSITAKGEINQQASTTIKQEASAGQASFSVGANKITLDQANTFTGPVALSNEGAKDVVLTNAAALSLGEVKVGTGKLTITSSGDLTQAANTKLTQNGSDSFAAVTLNANAGKITLTNTGNEIVGSLNLSNSNTSAVQVSDSSAISLGKVDVSGSLALQAGGNISQTDALLVDGASTLTVKDATASIVLENQGNSLAGAVSLVAAGTGSISLASLYNKDAGAQFPQITGSVTDLTVEHVAGMALPALTLAGNLNITSGGSITQNGAINIGGTTQVKAGSNSVQLTQNENVFAKAVHVQNTGNNNVSLVGKGALTLGNLQVGSGSLNVSATGAISQAASTSVTQEDSGTTGNATFTTTSASIKLDAGSNSLVGAVGLNNQGNHDVELNNNRALQLGASKLGSGSLKVTAAGALSQAAALEQVAGAGSAAASFDVGNNPIDLSFTGNDFVGAVSLTNTGNHTVSLNDNNALQLGRVNVGSGALNIVGGAALTQSDILTQSGAGAVSITATSGAITLNNEGNDFVGKLALKNSGANDVSITDTNTLTLHTSKLAQNLNVKVSGKLDQDGAVEVGGLLTVTMNKVAADVLLENVDNVVGGFSLKSSGSGSDNGSIGTASLSNKSETATFPTLDAPITNLSLNFSKAGVELPAMNLAGALDVKAGGKVSQSGILKISGTTSISVGAAEISLPLDNAFGGNVNLTNSGNKNITLKDADTLKLGTVKAGSGSVNLIAVGAIEQNGALTQEDAANTVNVTAGTSIALNHADNDFIGALALSSGTEAAVSVVDKNSLILGSSTLGSGGLTVTTKGAITQAGALQQVAAVDKATALSFNSGGNNIVLDKANDFVGAVNLTGAGVVTLNDSNALNLGTVKVASGALSVTSSGDLSQSGVLTHSDSKGTVSFSAGTGAITLENKDNSLSGSVSLNSSGTQAVKLNNVGDLVLAASSVGSGSVSLQASGKISQSGALVQADSLTPGSISVQAGSNAIALDNANNDFKGSVQLTNEGPNAVSLRDKNSLLLGSVSVGSGSLSIVAGGDITQNAALTQSGAGAVSINAGANAITLTHAGNDFKGSVGLFNETQKNVVINDLNTLDLATSKLGSGGLTVTAGGNISQNGGSIQQDVSANTFSQFTSSTGQITLNASNNAFGGAVGLNTPSHATVHNASDLTLGLSKVDGNFAARADGNIGQSAALEVKGSSTFTIANKEGNVMLGSANDFTGTVTIASDKGTVKNVMVRNISDQAANPVMPDNLVDLTLQFDNTSLTMPTTKLSGNLSVTAGKGIAQNGDLTVQGSSIFITGDYPITLNRDGNDFTGAVSLQNSGVNDVKLTDKNTLQLGTSSVGKGELQVLAGGTLSQKGAITQAATAGSATFNAGENEIKLDAANDFTGSVNLTNKGDFNATVSDVNALQLGTMKIGKNLAVNAGGNITQSAPLTLNGEASFTITANQGSLSLTDVGNDFSGAVTVAKSGSGVVNDVSIVNLSTNPSFPVLPSGVKNLSLEFSKAEVALPGVDIDGNLKVLAGGQITQVSNTALVVDGDSSFDAGTNPITLGNADNNMTGAVSLKNSAVNDVRLHNSKNLLLGASSLGGGKLEISSGGKISQNAALTHTGGNVSLTSAKGGIDMSQENDFVGPVQVTALDAQNAVLTDVNTITLGASEVGGQLEVTAGGDITQSGALQVGAASKWTIATQSGTPVVADVLLASQPNIFNGSVTVANGKDGTVRNVALRNLSVKAALPVLPSGVFGLTLEFDNAALSLPATSVEGNLVVRAGGAITQGGTLKVGGTAEFSAGKHSITLSDSNNDFKGTVKLSNSEANNVTLHDANKLTLAASTVGTGLLTLKAGTELVQEGALVQAGGKASGANFSVTAGPITLTNANNQLSGPISLNNSGKHDVALVNQAAVDIAASKLGSGKLSVQAGGAISQSGTLTQEAGADESRFVTEAFDISLNNENNAFNGRVVLQNKGSSNTVIKNNTALLLGASNVGSGTLEIVTKGALTQDGALVQAGSSAGLVTINANANPIALTNGGNDFVGAVSLNNTGKFDVRLTDSNALTLNKSVVGSGVLEIKAGGAITQTAALTQASAAGQASFETSGTIMLENVGNDFTGAVALKNSGSSAVSLSDANSLLLGRVDVGSGSLTITSQGPLEQNAALTQAANAGAVTLASNAGSMTLEHAENQLTGVVTLSNSGLNNVSLVNNAALKLGSVTVGSGNLSLRATGAVSQEGPLTQAAGAGFASITATGGAITLNNTGNDFTGALRLNNSGTGDVAVLDKNQLDLGLSQVGSGALQIVAAGGISQSGALAQAANAGKTSFTATNGSINLGNADNSLTGTVTLNNSGANDVLITNKGGLQFGASSVGSGKLKVSAGGAITQTGAIVQASKADQASFDAGANAITLTNASNDFTGAVALKTTGNGNASLTDMNQLVLAETSVGNDLNVVMGGHLSQTGTLLVKGKASFTMNTNSDQNVMLASAPNDFAGAVSILNGSGSIAEVELRNVHLNADSSASLTLPNRLHSLKLNYDNSAIAMSGATLTGNLEARAGGAITQTGPLLVTGTASFAAGAHKIELTNNGNDFKGTVNLSNSGLHNVALTDATALQLGKVEVGSGKLEINSGALSQSTDGYVRQDPGAGVASFNTGTNSIALTSSNNEFTGAVSLNNSGNNAVALVNKSALILGASTVGSGSLSVTAGGAVSQNAALRQAPNAGASSFAAGANSITLDHADNDFTGALTLSNSGGNNIVVRDANSLTLGASKLGSGSVSLQANGKLNQTGALEQESGAGLVTLDAGNGVLEMAHTANNLTGAVSLKNSGANNVSLHNARALTLAESSVGSGQLTVTASGAISQNAALKQAASAAGASFKVAGNSITLNHSANDFTAGVSLENTGTNDVSINDANDLVLAASSVGSGNLNITAGGKISQTGALLQAAPTGNTTATVSVNAGQNSVTLDNVGNDFSLPVNLQAGASQIVDRNNLVLGRSNVASLEARSVAGNISQTAAAVVKGNSKFEAVAGSVTLAQSGNDFGTLELNAVTAQVNDTNALNLGNVEISGGLEVNTGGNITQAQGTAVKVAEKTTLNALGQSVLLAGGNDFATLDIKAASARITDINALQVNATTSADLSLESGALTLAGAVVGGNLQAKTSGALTQSAAVTVTGNASFETGANALVLDKANDFKGQISATNSGGANGISITDVNAINLAHLQTDGNLVLNAVGITQANAAADSSSLKVGGSSSINAGAGVITLDGAQNTFGTALALNNTGNHAVVVKSAGALQLGKTNIGGSLQVNASGEITQSEALILAGNASFDAGTAALNLSRANEFGGKLSTNAGATQITAAKALDVTLNASGATTLVAADKLTLAGNINGNLSLNAAGAVNQSGALKVAGNSTLKIAAANVAELTHAGNDFAGSLTLEGSANVVDANALNANLSGNGEVSLKAGAALDVAGNANNLNTSAVGKTTFGNTKVVKHLNIISLGGEIALMVDKLLDAPIVSLTLPSTLDLGSASNQFNINSSETVNVLAGNNGFIQIPLNVKTTFVVSAGVGCVRVNMGACVNGNAVISGAISAVQAGALTGLTSKLAKEDNSTKKITYGFAGKLDQAVSLEHGGAIAVQSIPSCRSGVTVGQGSGGGVAVESINGNCGSAQSEVPAPSAESAVKGSKPEEVRSLAPR